MGILGHARRQLQELLLENERRNGRVEEDLAIRLAHHLELKIAGRALHLDLVGSRVARGLARRRRAREHGLRHFPPLLVPVSDLDVDAAKVKRQCWQRQLRKMKVKDG